MTKEKTTKKPVLIQADMNKARPTLTYIRCPKCQGKWIVEVQGQACPDCNR